MPRQRAAQNWSRHFRRAVLGGAFGDRRTWFGSLSRRNAACSPEEPNRKAPCAAPDPPRERHGMHTSRRLQPVAMVLKYSHPCRLVIGPGGFEEGYPSQPPRRAMIQLAQAKLCLTCGFF